MLDNPENYKVDSDDEETCQNVEVRCRLNGREGVKPTVIVALVRVFGVAPFGKIGRCSALRLFDYSRGVVSRSMVVAWRSV